jgi:hypothetical protein
VSGISRTCRSRRHCGKRWRAATSTSTVGQLCDGSCPSSRHRAAARVRGDRRARGARRADRQYGTARAPARRPSVGRRFDAGGPRLPAAPLRARAARDRRGGAKRRRAGWASASEAGSDGDRSARAANGGRPRSTRDTRSSSSHWRQPPASSAA